MGCPAYSHYGSGPGNPVHPVCAVAISSGMAVIIAGWNITAFFAGSNL